MSAGEAPDPDDLYEYYYEHLELSGKSVRTIKCVKTSASLFQDFLDENSLSEGNIIPRDVLRLKRWLDEPSRCEKTVRNHLTRLMKMYAYYNRRGLFDANPFSIALEEVEWDITDDTSRVEKSLSEMRNAVQETNHVLQLVAVVLMLKTGIRNGEATNLDLRDIHLQHPYAEKLLPNPRPEIKDSQDTIYVDSDIGVGDVINGRERIESNKRKRSTRIPVDEELKATLIYWLMARPPSICPADPLLVRINGPRAGDRHDADSLKWIIKKWSKKQGWYEKGAGERNNVTSQYFRHFFTTHMRRRVNSNEIGGNEAKYFVKGIRGDIGGDVIDTYTQEWGNYVREAYLNNIYTLF